MRSLLLILMLTASPLAAQQRAAQPAASGITEAELDAHVRFLSHDLLEGRAPATRGGRLTEEYLRSQLQSYGVEPGVNGSYFQRVPIDIVTADASSIRVQASGRATATLRHPEDVVVWASSATEQSRGRGEVVFVGYGAHAPEYQWDDFGDMDLRGKILLVLVNDPGFATGDSTIFNGRAMTYYGRWTYKFEEAARRGAAGMLIVHQTEAAGYPWHTVVGSWAKEQRMLPRDTTLPPALGFHGWITDSAATALLRQGRHDLAQLRERAKRRDFRPVGTGIDIDVGFRNTVENLESNNVVGIVRGRDSRLRDEYIAFSAHWDHLGIGPPVNGDSIYNGAYDNASGTAAILGIARAAAANPPAGRSFLFVFVTAEESGLLGSAYFGQNPTVPIGRIIANLNMDGVTLHGRVRTLRVLGADKSSLGPQLGRMVAADDMRIAPDAYPERGYFFRSDHFSFAKAGVPAISVAAGMDYVGRPEGWGQQRAEEYTAQRYHQPSDEYREDFDYSGAVQLSEIVLRLARQLSTMQGVPAWNADAEFRAVREGQRTGR
jgi:Zn-dependent M28 family amino/carboxypeptidase